MGDAFGVNFAALDCAAGDFAAVESGLREADIAGPFEGISEALPGSRTMVASLWISTRLGASVQVFGDHAKGLSSLATATRQSYFQSDEGAALRMHQRLDGNKQ